MQDTLRDPIKTSGVSGKDCKAVSDDEENTHVSVNVTDCMLLQVTVDLLSPDDLSVSMGVFAVQAIQGFPQDELLIDHDQLLDSCGDVKGMFGVMPKCVMFPMSDQSMIWDPGRLCNVFQAQIFHLSQPHEISWCHKIATALICDFELAEDVSGLFNCPVSNSSLLLKFWQVEWKLSVERGIQEGIVLCQRMQDLPNSQEDIDLIECKKILSFGNKP